MIATRSRSAHHTPLFFPQNDRHQLRFSGSDLDIKHSSNPANEVQLGCTPNDSPSAAVVGVKRAMTTVTTHQKRRATSPSFLSRPAALSPLITPKHHSTATNHIPFGLGIRDETPIDLFPIQLPPPMSDDPKMEHVIQLSSIEQCMPRAYIRVCLAYRLRPSEVDTAIAGLNNFVRRTVEAKPYLAGYVVPVGGGARTGPVEIRFLNEDYEHYPSVVVRDLLDQNGEIMDFEELNSMGFPPSKLDPGKVSALPATIADERKAPVFRAQANLVKGGIIVSLYLHHCISDGTGLGQLTSGSVQDDDFTFSRHLEGLEDDPKSLGKRLAIFADHQSAIRASLSQCTANQRSDREILFKRLGENTPGNAPGRGCVISFPDVTIDQLRTSLMEHRGGAKLSKHDTLQALIWRHMVRARKQVVRKSPHITTSKLLIPVNVRNRLEPKLPDGYFGAAVDFACARCDIDEVAGAGNATLARAAKLINQAVSIVDNSYIRQTVALANTEDSTIDVRDLLASNMNRVSGADLYITSWERLPLYEATLGMGLGRPDWVRKPWSRDPGSCIILPRNEAKAQFEVVIQMTQADMAALLEDREFMSFVGRVID